MRIDQDILREGVKLNPISGVASAFTALLLTTVLWTFHAYVLPSVDELPTDPLSLAYLRQVLFEKGFIPLLILWTFLFSILQIIQIRANILAPLDMSSAADLELISSVRAEDLPGVVKALRQQEKSDLSGYYGKRLRLIFRRYGRDRDLVATQNSKDQIISTDEEKISLAFVPVLWSEIALPLEGFLGTVIGIGQSMAQIKHVVGRLDLGEALQSEWSSLSEALGLLSLAFDTTLVALLFVLIVGIWHMSTKKAIANRLSDAGDIFGRFVYQLNQAEEPVLEGVLSVRDRIDRILLAGGRGREVLEHVVVRHSACKELREILFGALVEFDPTEDWWLTSSLQEAVGGSKHVDCLGLSAFGETGALVYRSGSSYQLVVAEGQHLTVSSPVDVEKASALIPSQDGLSVLLSRPDGALQFLKRASLAGRESWEMARIPDGKPGDVTVPVRLANEELVLLVSSSPTGSTARCLYMGSGQVSKLKAAPEFSGFRWTIWSDIARSGVLAAAGQSMHGHGWRLALFEVKAAKTPQRNETNETDASEVDVPSLQKIAHYNLARELTPKRLVFAASGAKKDILLLDTQGLLYRWSPKFMMRRLQHTAWEPRPDIALRIGRDGWLAVADGSKIEMWTTRAFSFEKYEKACLYEPHAGNLNTVLHSSSGGHYLVGIWANRLTTWRFPHVIADTF